MSGENRRRAGPDLQPQSLFRRAGLDPADDGIDLEGGEGFLAVRRHDFVVVAGEQDGADDFGSSGITGNEGGA